MSHSSTEFVKSCTAGEPFWPGSLVCWVLPAMGVSPTRSRHACSITWTAQMSSSSWPYALNKYGMYRSRNGKYVSRDFREVRSKSMPIHSSGTGSVKEGGRSEEHTSELQSLMRISYAVF